MRQRLRYLKKHATLISKVAFYRTTWCLMRSKCYKQQASEEDLEKTSTSLCLGLAAWIALQQTIMNRVKRKGKKRGKKRQKRVLLSVNGLMLRGPSCSGTQLEWDHFRCTEGWNKRIRDKQSSTEKWYTCTLWRFHANICTPHILTCSLGPQFRWRQQTFIPCSFHQRITFLVLPTTELLHLRCMQSSSLCSQLTSGSHS